jgi:hypothetical protein
MGVIAGCGWMLLVAACERSFVGNQIWLVGSEYDAGTLQAGQSFVHRAWLVNPTLRHIRIRPESAARWWKWNSKSLLPSTARLLQFKSIPNNESRATIKKKSNWL